MALSGRMLIGTVFGLVGCASSTSLGYVSLYLTSSHPLVSPADDGYVFLGPYFAFVDTKIRVAFIPAVTDGAGKQSSPLTVQITTVPIPTGRAYLYFRKNAFYNNIANITVASDGMLSSSDTSSVQQVTSILNEIAQTIG